MKKIIIMLMLCAPMAVFAQKFGHLDSQALIQSLPEAIKVQSELEAQGKIYENDLKAMQDELQRKAEEYDKTKSTMNATKQAETILDKVRKAIEEVAKAGGYVYIMEKAAGQPLYINEAVSKDVTAEVKARLK